MSQIPVLRILDASLNRATEGLRVVEDYARFVLDDPFLTTPGENAATRLGGGGRLIAVRRPPRSPRHADEMSARKSRLPAESDALDAWDVCAASFKRAEQSLRSLEEYGKIVSIRFRRPMRIASLSTLYARKGVRHESRQAANASMASRSACLLDGRASVGRVRDNREIA